MTVQPDPSRSSEEISVERDGVTHTGTFQIYDTEDTPLVRVFYRGESSAAQTGGMTPRILAAQLLSELVRSQKPQQ